jgi:hypothetical protein
MEEKNLSLKDVLCPFCGGSKVRVWTMGDGYWSICCVNDECLCMLYDYESREEAINAWITRKSEERVYE